MHDADLPTDPVAILARWRDDAKVRAEFGDVVCFQGFCEALAAGRVRIYGGGPAAGALLPGEEPPAAQGLPLAERARLIWELLPAVRAEFRGNFQAYLGFRSWCERRARGR